MTINIELIWLLLFLTLLGGAIGLHFIYNYYERNSKLRKEVDSIVKDVKYMRRMIDNHFKTTSETITDLRDQRKKAEKENTSLKVQLEELQKKFKKP